MADMNAKVRYNLGLLKRRSIFEREEFFRKTGRNRIIDSKTKLSDEEKEKLKEKFVEYYVRKKRKQVKIFVFSVMLSCLILWGALLLIKSAGLY